MSRRGLPGILIGLFLISFGLPFQTMAAAGQAAKPAAAVHRPSAEEARGTGVLPNFRAKGSHLVRLLAGAFDPVEGRAPKGAAIPHVSESSLPAGTSQY